MKGRLGIWPTESERDEKTAKLHLMGQVRPKLVKGDNLNSLLQFLDGLVSAGVRFSLEAKFRPVVVACPCVEINKNVTVIHSTQKQIQGEILQHQEPDIMKLLYFCDSLSSRNRIDCLRELDPRFVKQIIKSPIRLWVQFS